MESGWLRQGDQEAHEEYEACLLQRNLHLNVHLISAEALGEVSSHDEVVAEGERRVLQVHLKLVEYLSSCFAQQPAPATQQEMVEVVDAVLELGAGRVLRLMQEDGQQVVVRERLES